MKITPQYTYSPQNPSNHTGAFSQLSWKFQMQTPLCPPFFYSPRTTDGPWGEKKKKKSQSHPFPPQDAPSYRLMAPPVTLKSTDGHPVRKSLTFRMSDSKHFLKPLTKHISKWKWGKKIAHIYKKRKRKNPGSSSSSSDHLSLCSLPSLKRNGGGRRRGREKKRRSEKDVGGKTMTAQGRPHTSGSGLKQTGIRQAENEVREEGWEGGCRWQKHADKDVLSSQVPSVISIKSVLRPAALPCEFFFFFFAFPSHWLWSEFVDVTSDWQFSCHNLLNQTFI